MPDAGGADPVSAKRELKRRLRVVMSHQELSPDSLMRRAQLQGSLLARSVIYDALAEAGSVPSLATLISLLDAMYPESRDSVEPKDSRQVAIRDELISLRARAAKRTKPLVQVGVIPETPSTFQHRAVADQLDGAGAAAGRTAEVSQVLVGTGGVGKTQLAAQYARSVRGSGSLSLLVWVTATSRDAVVSGYADAGRKVRATTAEDPEQAAVDFNVWLRKTPQRWLLVLDDLANAAVLRDLWPPQAPGQCVITTRNRDARILRGRHRVDVGAFTQGEAAAYLTSELAAHGRSDDPQDLVALAEALGRLPLALAQAAAYLANSMTLTCREYRNRIVEHDETLSALMPHPDDLGDHRHTLAAAWEMSVQAADERAPSGLARPLLQLASMLDPAGIPAAVLTSAPTLIYLTGGQERSIESDPERGARLVEIEQAKSVMENLQRFSLIEYTRSAPSPGIHSVRVHQLIQRATRETLSPSQRSRIARTAADALSAIWPEIERDTDLAQTLRANTAILTRNATDALYRPDAHKVLFRAGDSLGESGQVSAAARHFELLARTTTRHLGPEHLDTLLARGEHANWQGHAGDATGAANALTELLDDSRALGRDHPRILTIRHNLAHWRGVAGEAAAAADALADLLRDRTRLLGPEHADTLTTGVNLARWRGEAGDAAGAADALAVLLEKVIRVQGADHPDTFFARGNLGYWRGKSGDATGAADTFAELLEDQIRVLGPDHPSTLGIRHNIATWRGHAGDAAGAATAFAELVEDRLRVLGPDHPSTLTARGNLARWRGEAGDAVGAAAAFAELLEDMARLLGPDHPHTLTARGSLARWRGDAGDEAGAVDALVELLQDRTRVLGPDHPHTLETRNNIAHLRGELGDAAGAARIFAELLQDRTRVLGSDHPQTLETRYNLARWRGEAGDAVGAAAEFAELLEDTARVLGPDHPRTQQTRHSLAHWRQARGVDGAR
ncbi:FxSxx-COOH system tetratricopeptide repeat protein [Streptomyces sp. NPDC048357]|uniref:FxSxx-COOH system tetratricopeptide repeat protein n=1 Tax=Streptomyces sp. NPDC048357 TaxID=3154719 RepID=UPI003412683E